MASYGYGPPPPPPPPSQPAGGYGQYQSSYQQGSHPRGGRGGGHYGGGRGGADYQAASGYGYGQQQPAQPYSQPAHYGNSAPQQHHPQGASYPPPQQPSWQQHDPATQSHGQHPQQSHNAMPPQNYNPSYPYQQPHPQYQQQGQPTQHQAPYGQQPPYAPPSSYGQQYPPPQPTGPPAQQPWGPPSQVQQNGHGGHYNSRGRGSSQYHDRGGGSKAQMMGPPIRLGFESGGPQGQGPPAPVSNGYPQQAPYGPPQGGPTPPAGPSGYTAGPPYQPYPPPAPAPVAGPPHYDSYYSQDRRHNGRGGYQNNSYRGGRPHFGGDKMRHKKPGGHNGPSSGTPVGSHPPQHHQKPDASSVGKKKKRKTNTLGLTPGEESDEDDVDEEAKLVEMIGPDAPNPTDITAWIEERKKNFPTQARIKAKLVERNDGEKPAKHEDGAKSVPALTALERKQQKAEKLRKQLEKVESSIKRKREQQDEGDEMRDVDDGESSDSSDSKSDDEAPESLPIRSEKKTAQAPVMPPAPKKADPSKHCKYYSTGGTCGKKGKCRFVHDPNVREAALLERERNGGRMTLQQRLTLNDKDQEDLTIIKTLQYLKEKGMMKDEQPGAPASSGTPLSTSATTASAKESSKASPAAATTKTEQPAISSGGLPHGLPQPPPSLLTPPAAATGNGPTVRYQGWNLSGFGNTGVKSTDP